MYARRIVFLLILQAMISCLAGMVRSNVGASHLMREETDEKKSYTAADYIQDGLVFMVDGIENAGWVIHDEDETKWKDLISGTVFNLSGKCQRDETSYKFISRSVSNINTVSMRNAVGSSIFTIEIVVKCSAFNAAIYMWGSPQGFSFTTLSDYAMRFLSGGTKISQTSAGVGTSAHTYSIVRESIYGAAFLDGYQVETVKECPALGSPTAGLDVPAGREVYSVRLYSRALTAAEIAANYAIDKARFNLP